MKAQRLLAILTILLNRKKVSAAYLARHFEVSLRTIYRDVEALGEAGIPVFSTIGRNGGFELMEGFTIDAQVLETGEVQQILAGLQSLSAVYSGPAVATIIEKFSLILKEGVHNGIHCPKNHIFIELTPSGREKQTIDKLEQCIKNEGVMRIGYSDINGCTTERDCEPLALVFIWHSWYTYTFCRLRGDFRLFKVSRILASENINEKRLSPPVDLDSHPWTKDWESKPFEKIVFTAGKIARVKIEEFFDRDAIDIIDSDTLRVTTQFPVDEWVISFIMGLPGSIQVLEPASMREAIRDRASQFLLNNA